MSQSKQLMQIFIFIISVSVEWLLVKFTEDGILSRPLKLGEVCDEESGQCGEELDIQEGDYCMAPYNGVLYKAKVLLRSGLSKFV